MFVEIAPGLTLSYADQGSGSRPAVLFLPGPTDSWRSYQPVLDRLPDDVRAVSVSQRGHGDSDKPATGYAVEDFAHDAVALLDVLGIERAVLVGHSGSCLVARRVALDHPDRVEGVVLEASPFTLQGNVQLRHFLDSVVSELEDPVSPDFARSFVLGTSAESVAPDLVDLLANEILKVPARVWKQTFSQLLEYDDRFELGSIQAPVLLVWGDVDTLVSREMQDCLVEALAETRLLVYAGVGHTPRWEDPARFSRDLVVFARELGV